MIAQSMVNRHTKCGIGSIGSSGRGIWRNNSNSADSDGMDPPPYRPASDFPDLNPSNTIRRFQSGVAA